MAGTTLAMTVLHGPSTIDSKTIAPKRTPSETLILGSRMQMRLSGTETAAATKASSR